MSITLIERKRETERIAHSVWALDVTCVEGCCIGLIVTDPQYIFILLCIIPLYVPVHLQCCFYYIIAPYCILYNTYGIKWWRQELLLASFSEDYSFAFVRHVCVSCTLTLVLEFGQRLSNLFFSERNGLITLRS